MDTYSRFSKRAAGGGSATVTRGLCISYLQEMIEGIKSYKPEFKASKSVQPPTLKKFDIPAYY